MPKVNYEICMDTCIISLGDYIRTRPFQRHRKEVAACCLLFRSFENLPPEARAQAEWRVSVAWLRVKKTENVSIAMRRETEIGQ